MHVARCLSCIKHMLSNGRLLDQFDVEVAPHTTDGRNRIKLYSCRSIGEYDEYIAVYNDIPSTIHYSLLHTSRIIIKCKIMFRCSYEVTNTSSFTLYSNKEPFLIFSTSCGKLLFINLNLYKKTYALYHICEPFGSGVIVDDIFTHNPEPGVSTISIRSDMSWLSATVYRFNTSSPHFMPFVSTKIYIMGVSLPYGCKYRIHRDNNYVYLVDGVLRHLSWSSVVTTISTDVNSFSHIDSMSIMRYNKLGRFYRVNLLDFSQSEILGRNEYMVINEAPQQLYIPY